MRRLRIYHRVLKRVLESNKIYFEVGVATLLGFMAIVVANRANDIANLQTSIAKQTAIPHLEIRHQLEYNSKLKIWDNSIISIYNRGGKLLDFDFEEYSFMILRNSKKLMVDSISMPLDGYYDWKTYIGDGDGLVFQVNNNHNGVKEVSLRDSLSGVGFLEIETFAKLDYYDVLDSLHTVFYRISPNKGRISKTEWVALKQRSADAHYKNYFRRLRASDLIDSLKKQ